MQKRLKNKKFTYHLTACSCMFCMRCCCVKPEKQTKQNKQMLQAEQFLKLLGMHVKENKLCTG